MLAALPAWGVSPLFCDGGAQGWRMSPPVPSRCGWPAPPPPGSTVNTRTTLKQNAEPGGGEHLPGLILQPLPPLCLWTLLRKAALPLPVLLWGAGHPPPRVCRGPGSPHRMAVAGFRSQAHGVPGLSVRGAHGGRTGQRPRLAARALCTRHAVASVTRLPSALRGPCGLGQLLLWWAAPSGLCRSQGSLPHRSLLPRPPSLTSDLSPAATDQPHPGVAASSS